MLLRTLSGQFRRLVYYEPEPKLKTWHLYADVLVPLISLPSMCVIGLYLHYYASEQAATGIEYRSQILAFSIAFFVVSFLVFIYVCIRMSTILGGRSRLRLPIIRSNRSPACFLKPVNSDLEFMAPFNNHPISYDSIVFEMPPYPKSKPEKKKPLARIDSDEGLTM